MLDQTFAVGDFPKVFFLAFLEILLSADNAVVLAILASHLPESLRKKALLIGVLSAFFIRGFALLTIGFLLQHRWIQIFGALYLIYLCINHFKKKQISPSPSYKSFWKTVFLIELFDIAFAIDSIVAGFAFVSTENKSFFLSKIWIIYVGGMIGLIAIRYASHILTGLMHSFPRLERSAYLMIGWIGLKLGCEPFIHSVIFETIFWVGLVSLFSFGFFQRKPRHG